MNIEEFKNPVYAGLFTSEEILAAIEEVARDGFLKNGKINKLSRAYKIWLDPAQGEFSAVKKIAYELRGDSESELFWGNTRV